MATNKLIDLSRLSRFWDKVKNYIDSKLTNLPAEQGGTDNTLVTTGDKYNWNNNDASNKVSKSGDTMTGDLTIQGFDINLGVRTGTEDSSDLVWKNGSSGEKMRIWSPNSPTAIQGPNFRIYKDDGTQLFTGQLALGEASGWAKGANLLNSRGTIGTSSQNHAQALQSYFNSYKASTPRNCGINFYSSAYGNGALAIGYFLNGYDSTPYGGFFICHYNTPRYVGIHNGTYTQYDLYHSGSTIPIAHGGTGATSKTGAGTNLGFNWSGKNSVPYWVWGGDNQGEYYVYRPHIICGLNLAGTTTNYTAKSFTISAATELVIVCRYSNKIFSTSVPYNAAIIGSSYQELWVGGGKGGSGAVAGDAARCLCNIKVSGTTFTLQGVSCTNEGTMLQSGITWYVYYR